MTEKHPIQDMLAGYAESDAARFHMPGHKGRAVLRGEWDITELEETDNLQHPRGAIAASQALWAKAAGVGICRYLVNGSTLGIQAMVLGCLPRGGRLIASRDAHRSLPASLAAFGVRPVWAESKWDEEQLLYRCGVSGLLKKLEETPDADGVFVTTPDYYGRMADTAPLAAACAARGIPLLADCAHGGLAQFLPNLPRIQADVWVVSAHKTLFALTQTALLFGRMERPKLDAALRTLQTSSPSYLMMASLEQSLEQAEQVDLPGFLRYCMALRERIAGVKGLRCGDSVWAEAAGFAACDPGRLCVDVTGRGLSGYRAAEALRAGSVRVEMADLRRVVCILSPWDAPSWGERLAEAFSALPAGDFVPPRIHRPPEGEPCIPPWEAAGRAWTLLPLSRAVGRILAEPLTVYPPGTALCMPGERLTSGVAAYCRQVMELGGDVAGGENIAVVEE